MLAQPGGSVIAWFDLERAAPVIGIGRSGARLASSPGSQAEWAELRRYFRERDGAVLRSFLQSPLLEKALIQIERTRLPGEGVWAHFAAEDSMDAEALGFAGANTGAPLACAILTAWIEQLPRSGALVGGEQRQHRKAATEAAVPPPRAMVVRAGP